MFLYLIKRHKIATGIALVVLALLITISFYVKYLSSTISVTISYDNSRIEKVKIVRYTGVGEAISVDTILENIESDKTVRVPHVTTEDQRGPDQFYYKIEYTGVGDYANGYEIIDDNKPLKITLQPDYSQDKYTKMIEDSKPEIEKLIREKYPKAMDYKIDTGKMFEYGKWYCTKLIYQGEYSKSSDNLRILLKNEDGKWQLATEPNIILLQKNYSDIPQKILSIANNYDSGLTF